jgi:hypothetical protein
MSDYILVLDEGTTSTRAMLFDAAGAVHGVAQHALTQHYPAPGLVEHDPAEIWDKTLAAAQELVAKAGGPDRIAAIGITNQRETVVAWDRMSGEPLAPAIVWQDRRTAEACAALKAAGISDEQRQLVRSGALRASDVMPKDTSMTEYQRESLALRRAQAGRAGQAGAASGGAPSPDRAMQSVNDEVLRFSRTPIKGLVEDRMPTEQETYQYRDQMLRLMGLAPRTGQPGAAASTQAAAQTPPAMPAARPDTQPPQAAAPAGDVPSLAGGRNPFRGPLTQAEAAQLGVDYAQYQQNPEYRKFVDSQR